MGPESWAASQSSFPKKFDDFIYPLKIIKNAYCGSIRILESVFGIWARLCRSFDKIQSLMGGLGEKQENNSFLPPTKNHTKRNRKIPLRLRFCCMAVKASYGVETSLEEKMYLWTNPHESAKIKQLYNKNHKKMGVDGLRHYALTMTP